MKGYLEYDGIEVNSPRGAFKVGLIKPMVLPGLRWLKIEIELLTLIIKI